MNYRFLILTFIIFSLSCTNQEKGNVENTNDTVVEQTESQLDLNLKKFRLLISEYYPEFKEDGHQIYVDDYDKFIIMFCSDTLGSNDIPAENLNGPLISFYENDNPELLRFYKDNDYYKWEYWFDSTGYLEEEKLRFRKPLGDEGKIRMFRKYDSIGNVINQWYVQIEEGETFINIENGNKPLILNYKWGCNECDSLEISYGLSTVSDTSDYISLGKFEQGSEVFEIDSIPYETTLLSFQFKGFKGAETGAKLAYIHKDVVFIE